MLKAGGPALLFERPKGHTMPVLGNLFGTVKRVALGMGVDADETGRGAARDRAAARLPETARAAAGHAKDAWDKLPLLKTVHLDGRRVTVRARRARKSVWEGTGRRSRPVAGPDLLARRTPRR